MFSNGNSDVEVSILNVLEEDDLFFCTYSFQSILFKVESMSRFVRYKKNYKGTKLF